MKGIWKYGTRAEVNGTLVCSADMMVAPEVKG
jgi:3-hydroxymyristoyl/3-hydroxydecanoyl-(acyl carrier protein) dehydratase